MILRLYIAYTLSAAELALSRGRGVKSSHEAPEGGDARDTRPVTSSPCYLLTLHCLTHMILLTMPGAAGSPVQFQLSSTATGRAQALSYMLNAAGSYFRHRHSPTQRLYAPKTNVSA